MHKIDIGLANCELKFDSGKKGQFTGYASTFGNVDSYNDTIIPGAYQKTIGENPTLPMFINHKSLDIPVGTVSAMSEDEKGLIVTGTISMKHRDGESLRAALEDGSMTGLSIGYTIPSGGSEKNDNGGHDLKAIDLKEISAVTYPADDHARIGQVKAAISSAETIRDFDRLLRDAGGFSRSAANEFVSRFKSFILSDLEQKQSETKQNEGAEILALINKYKV